MSAPSAFSGVFAGRRVLLTGHTGFKGSWLARWLLELGADVWGIALQPDTEPSLFNDLDLGRHLNGRIADMRDPSVVEDVVRVCRPEIVFHLAAQPLVRRSYAEPTYTFETNVLGTAYLLQALRGQGETRAVVNVTTDKVYENPENGKPFSEDEPLGGKDPYSASKACSEIVTASMRSSFFAQANAAAVATARAGNVVGGGDWAADRIVPDIVRALRRGERIGVRNPAAVRPWQHVLEPLAGYLNLASLLWRDGHEYAEAWNFGPDLCSVRTVEDVVERSIKAWGSGSWDVPEIGEQPHEAELLRLSTDKAAARLGWNSVWDFEHTIDRTLDWYRRYTEAPARADDLIVGDLAAYVVDARASGAPWA